MNNENNNIGNQIPNNNQNINVNNQIPNNNEFNQTTQQYQQTVNPQTNLNNTPTNNNYNPATSQFITQQPANNNKINNSFNQNNMYQQSQMNDVNTMNSNQAQYNPQPPIYQNQSYMNNNVPVDKKSNNRKLFLFLGIGIAIFIAIIILVIVLIGGDKKENINEYEEDTNINDNVSDQTTDSKNIYSYNGFDFNKVAGYVYSEEEGALTISNDSIGILLKVSQVNFNNVKANYTSAIPRLSSYGYVVGESKVDTYSNVEVVTYQINKDGISGFYYILPAPNSSYIYEGIVVNTNSTVDYSNINEVVKITNNSKYNGNYSNYSSDFGINVDVKGLIEN